jgi:hypothetical protein
MIQIHANLAQRILDAARLAAAIHEEQTLGDRASHTSAGGAGRAAFIDHDGRLPSMDGIASPHDRVRPRIR